MSAPDEHLEATETEDDRLDEPEGEAAEGPASPKVRKTFAQRATGNLRVAKRGLQGQEWKAEDRAQFLLAEANVLALLDLASAIREARASGGSEANGASASD
jgi:hypothetical protein